MREPELERTPLRLTAYGVNYVNGFEDVKVNGNSYQVDRISVETKWTAGKESEAKHIVILEVRFRHPDGRLGLGRADNVHVWALDEIPDWIKQIITEETPEQLRQYLPTNWGFRP